MQGESHAAPLAIRPTRLTLYLRRCVPWQLFRFVLINLRMVMMILKSHHTRLDDGPHGRDIATHAS